MTNTTTADDLALVEHADDPLAPVAEHILELEHLRKRKPAAFHFVQAQPDKCGDQALAVKKLISRLQGFVRRVFRPSSSAP